MGSPPRSGTAKSPSVDSDRQNVTLARRSSARSSGAHPRAIERSGDFSVTMVRPPLFSAGDASESLLSGRASAAGLPPRSPQGPAGFREDPLPALGRAPSPLLEGGTRRPMTTPDQLRDLALQLLGPGTAAALADWEYASNYDALRSTGTAAEDALLSLAFTVSKRDRAVQGEFLSYFKGLLFGQTSTDIGEGPSAKPSRGGDTDLMQSVVGDLLPGFHSLYFNSKAQFLSLLQQRLRWKRLDRLKTLGPVPHSLPGELDQLALETDAGDGPSTPLTELIQYESEARIVRTIRALPDGDSRLIRAMIDGEPRGALIEELGVSPEALRQRLRRARLAFEKALKAGPPDAGDEA